MNIQLFQQSKEKFLVKFHCVNHSVPFYDSNKFSLKNKVLPNSKSKNFFSNLQKEKKNEVAF